MLKLGWFLTSFLVLVAHCQGAATTMKSAPEKEGLEGIRLPNVPSSLEEFRYASRFVSIWENRAFELNETSGLITKEEPEDSKPKIILAPTEAQMINLLPQNAPHPLYSKKYGNLADNFILDSLSTGILNPEDNRLDTPEGHTIHSISGKCLLFKRNLQTQKLTVNGIVIVGFYKTAGSDPVTVCDLDGFLFDHRRGISEAFNDLMRSPSSLDSIISTTAKNPATTSQPRSTISSILKTNRISTTTVRIMNTSVTAAPNTTTAITSLSTTTVPEITTVTSMSTNNTTVPSTASAATTDIMKTSVTTEKI